MEPLSNGLPLASFCDESLQDTKFFYVPWLVTLRIMKDQMFVVRRCNSFVDVSRTSSVVLDILDSGEQRKDTRYKDYTAREVLKIALIRDDFPIPDCYRTTMNTTSNGNRS